jgi:uncharacterized protein YndB with AHSA1/START domain
MSAAEAAAPWRELALTRHIAAPPRAIWRCWTEPELLKQWFAPRPWTTARAELDVRPGGASLIVMRGPDGAEFPNRGQYLAVEPAQRLVFTDAYVGDWEAGQQAFMTVTITLVPDGAGTLYTARVAHWSEADRERHEQMGFHTGWAQCAEQLADLAATL